MNYRLRRLLCTRDEAHIQLNTNIDQQVEIIPNTNMFFKINVASKLPPGKLLILYAGDQYVKNLGVENWQSKKKIRSGKLVDLRICYSNAGVTEPSETSCTKFIQNPLRSFPLPPPLGRETYDQEWLYLSMFSASGCVFTANVLFKDEERNVVKRQKNLTDD